MPRRLVPAALASAACALAFLAAPALAEPPACNDPTEPGCEPVERTETATRKLSVTKTAGTVISTPAGIDCGATCSVTKTVSRTCLDDFCESWPAQTHYTLSASGGPAGYSPSWSECGAQATCSVSLGDFDDGGEFKTVALSWIDTTAPTATFAPAAKVGPSNFNVSAGATDNSGSIARYSWTVDNVAQATTGSVLSLGGLSNGNHSVTVRAHDHAGNVSAPVTKTVAVDKAVGVSAAALPAVTNAATVPLTFTRDADVVATACSLDGGAYAPCASGWSGIGAATADGAHTYRVKVTDDVGNVAESAVLTTVVDRTLPVLAFTDGPSEGQEVVTRNASVTFSLTEARLASVKCKLDGGPWNPCTAGAAIELIGLTDGPHVLSVQAVDTAGNTRTISRTFGVKVPSTAVGDRDGGTPRVNVGGTPAIGTPPSPGTPNGPSPSRFAPRFAHDYVYAGKLTKFTSLAIRGLPKTAKVTVACKGGGCAGKSKAIKHSGGKLNVLKALKSLKLKAGAKLTVTVRGDGGARAIARYAIRGGKRPVDSYRCGSAGGKLAAC